MMEMGYENGIFGLYYQTNTQLITISTHHHYDRIPPGGNVTGGN